jgi:hypothetical protein
VAFDKAKAAGIPPAAENNLVLQDYKFHSTGGAFKTSRSANLTFIIFYEPPFLDDSALHK